MRIGYNDALQKIFRCVNHVSLNCQMFLCHLWAQHLPILTVKKKKKRNSVCIVLKRGNCKNPPKEPVFLVCCAFLQPQNALCSWQCKFCPTAISPFYSCVPLATCSNAGCPESCLFPCIKAPEFYITFLLKDPDFSTLETPTILKQKFCWTRTDFQWYCCIGETHQEPWFLHDEKKLWTNSLKGKFCSGQYLTYYKMHKPPALLPGKKDF